MELLWTHHYCLGCDKQTDGAPYCTESCRLADGEKTPEFSMIPSTPEYSSTPGGSGGSSSSSQQLSPHQQPRQVLQQQQPQLRQGSRGNFYLPPAYDFSNAQPYGTTPRPSSFSSAMFGQQRSSTFQSTLSQRQQPHQLQAPALTPSSSQSSLLSFRSNASASTMWSLAAQPSIAPVTAAGAAAPSSDRPDAHQQLSEYARIWHHARLSRRRSY